MAFEPVPYVLTHDKRQLRYWHGGNGAELVVLPGLVLSAAEQARRILALNQNWSVFAIEPPGIGISQLAGLNHAEELVAFLASAIRALGCGQARLVSFDLLNGVAGATADRLGLSPQCRLHVANDFLTNAPFDPPRTIRGNGAHLLELWSLLRDANMLEPGGTRIATAGADLPGPEPLHETLIAAAVDPSAFWRLSELARSAVRPAVETPPEEFGVRLARMREGAAAMDAAPPANAGLEGAVWRDYADIPSGRVHLRRAGRGAPLFVLHAAPGSAGHLGPVLPGLAEGHEVIAPDYIGNGESARPRGEVSVGSMARDLLDLAGALGFDRFDIWGSHTGANVAIEASLMEPDRIGRMVLEAPILLDPRFTEEIFRNYFHPIVPDRWGTHLIDAWNFRRDLMLFWPWYRQERGAARRVGIPALDIQHDNVIGLLQSGATYQKTYKAAFAYPTAERMAMLSRPSLVCAGRWDSLYNSLEETRKMSLAAVSVVETPATVHYPGQEPAAVEETLAIYLRFLRGEPLRS